MEHSLYPVPPALHCAAAGIDGPCGYLHAVWRLRARHRLGHTRNACRAVWRRRMVGRFSGRRVGCLLRLCTRPFRHAPGCRSARRAGARAPSGPFSAAARRHARGPGLCRALSFPAGRTPLAALCLPRKKGSPPQSPSKRRPAAGRLFEAGFTLFLVRPLAALRPHYLLTPPAFRQPAPGTPDEDAVRRVHIPLADTLAVSRLLEQGFCGTALYEGCGRAARAPAGTTEPRIRRTRLPHRIYGRTSRKGHAP